MFPMPRLTFAVLLALAAGIACCHNNGGANLPSGGQAVEQPKQQPPAPAPTEVAPPPAGSHALTLEQAHQLLPRADLGNLSPEQLSTLHEVAGDTFDYAGCNSTLAACLKADVKDKHAPRMAQLAAMLIRDGYGSSQVVDLLERYYASFAKDKRAQLKTAESDCPTIGPAGAPVTLTEYSDYQCPHCAVAARWLHQLVDETKGAARLCSKYFPLQQHPRAGIAANAAEYARSKGKFWPLSALLFEHQEELGDAELKAYGKQVGLDGDEMVRLAYSGKFQPTIDAHVAEATAAGLRATPTFFFNGRQLVLPAKPEYLLFSVQDELEWIRGGGAWEKE
jgi:protein-disulfide isomerase